MRLAHFSFFRRMAWADRFRVRLRRRRGFGMKNKRALARMVSANMIVTTDVATKTLKMHPSGGRFGRFLKTMSATAKKMDAKYIVSAIVLAIASLDAPSLGDGPPSQRLMFSLVIW